MSSQTEPTRNRCRRRPMVPGAPRPSEQLGAFFVAALAFLAAAAVAATADALTDVAWLHWLSLHLVFLGGVSQLILGAGQFFTCAFLATRPPSRRFLALQLVVWNVAVILVAVGVPTGRTALVDVGGALVAVGLILSAAALRGMQRRSLQQARWAVRWYQACATFLGVGALLGVAMARGTAWSYGSLLGAHIALNVAGWMGTAIVGTLHTFFPSLTQTQLRLPRLQAPTFLLWTAGVWVLAAGAAIGSDAPMVAGWLALGVAATLLNINMIASLRRAPAGLALAARLVALGQLFLTAGIGVALGATFARSADAPLVGDARASVATLLLMGWIGLTVAGSLLHLLAVLARVRHFTLAMPGFRPIRDRLLLAGASAAVVGLAVGRQADARAVALAGGMLAVLVTAVLGVNVAALLIRAVAPDGSRRPVGRHRR